VEKRYLNYSQVVPTDPPTQNDGDRQKHRRMNIVEGAQVLTKLEPASGWLGRIVVVRRTENSIPSAVGRQETEWQRTHIGDLPFHSSNTVGEFRRTLGWSSGRRRGIP